jgi:hypothetical protein
MEAHYEEDLARSTEILLDHPPRLTRRRRSPRDRATRSARRALRTVTGIGHSIGAAVTGNRQLESWESTPVLTLGVLAAIVAALGYWQPRILSWPVVFLCSWIALSFITEAVTLWWSGRDRRE